MIYDAYFISEGHRRTEKYQLGVGSNFSRIFCLVCSLNNEIFTHWIITVVNEKMQINV